ncbi:helix-turn-helix transcriptional regulator [Saccharothrix saharensis]|uniref:helix-turn-helix domain-containing protein n=1 Tax=Saccharothrix saharensis TaxID=571190 RepID=UPI0036834AD6
MSARPPFRRRKLARRIRRMREAAGMTIEDAAAALDKHRNSLYRLEAGETRLDVHLARSMMDVYDHYDPDLIDQVRDALRPGWWTTFGLRDMGYVDVETEASAVWELALILIPGLLQTESYARAVLEANSLKRTKPELAAQVKVRMIRQKRLTSEENPLRLVALIDESALRQRIGGDGVMRDQLDHLVMVAELDAVAVRVLPRDLGAHAGQYGVCTLLDFPDPEDPSLLYVSHATGSLHIEDPEQVWRARMLIDHLLERALGPEDSIALIERILAERE